jgi:hypothetical protein
LLSLFVIIQFLGFVYITYSMGKYMKDLKIPKHE